MSSLKAFVIRVNNIPAAYAPGETIIGEVFVDLNEAKSCRGIYLRFKGKAKVKWTESGGSRRTRRTCSAEENYFGTEVYVVGRPDGEIELVAGQHVFPFTFTLPMNIPNSFEHKYGEVVYNIKAVMNMAWAWDPETCLPFTVYSPLDLSQILPRTIDDEVHADYCWCIFPCISEGFMEAQIHIPSSTYAIGEQLEVFVEITASSPSVDILGIELRLKQIIEFHAESKTKTTSEIVQRTGKNGPFQNNIHINLGLQVPSVPHSGFQHCSIMNIIYRLGVKFLVSGCHCDTKKYYDVMIGSKPIAPAQDVARSLVPPTTSTEFPTGGFAISRTSSIPTAPIPGMMGDLATITGTSNPPPYTPVPSIGFRIPSPSVPVELTSATVPPPSYESVMAEDSKK
ncbi:arrestin domain-containing protein 17 [Diachasma alloeum]|uniref:arrestin domain-containing protein 17 n=1 Tax=Diachasma alloeum TaxID=454923 RepID=UPI0007381C50|nr:arrestin domain-containing protein 17 [Diachasma alloeum]